MKKFYVTLIGAFFIGCNNSPQTPTKEIDVETELKILKKYSIDQSQLVNFEGYYLFDILETDGKFNLYLLDKNYNIAKKQNIKGVIEPKKLKTFKDKIYILGYDQEKNQTILLTFDKNLKELKREYFGNKFETPRDMIIKENSIIVALNSYKNGISSIKIVKNNNSYLFSLKTNNTNINFIKAFKDGFILAGEVQNETGNALLICVDKNFKTLWIRDLDLGLEENVKKLKVTKNSIIATIISQNYTGMEEEWDIEIDENGKILTKNKNFTINDIPLQFK